jgi:hypothetical protein
MLVTEFGVFDAVVTADTDDQAVQSREFVLMIGEIGGLQRAARRVISRIKKENEIVPASKPGYVDEFHIRIREDEHRSGLSFFQHGAPLKDPSRPHGSDRVKQILTKLPAPDYKKATPRNGYNEASTERSVVLGGFPIRARGSAEYSPFSNTANLEKA